MVTSISMPRRLLPPRKHLVSDRTLTGEVNATSSHDALFEKGELEHGYSEIAEVNVTVYPGTAVIINVDFTMRVISTRAFQTWWNEVCTKNPVLEELKQENKWTGMPGRVLVKSFGLVFGNGDASKFENTTGKWESRTLQQVDFARSLYTTSEANVRVRGKIRASATGTEPVRASVVVILTSIVYSDGKVITAFDTKSPVVVSRNGDARELTFEASDFSVSESDLEL